MLRWRWWSRCRGWCLHQWSCGRKAVVYFFCHRANVSCGGDVEMQTQVCRCESWYGRLWIDFLVHEVPEGDVQWWHLNRFWRKFDTICIPFWFDRWVFGYLLAHIEVAGSSVGVVGTEVQPELALLLSCGSLVWFTIVVLLGEDLVGELVIHLGDQSGNQIHCRR